MTINSKREVPDKVENSTIQSFESISLESESKNNLGSMSMKKAGRASPGMPKDLINPLAKHKSPI